MQAELLQMAKEYPVVTLVGPRQSGKTTLVQECFDKLYLDMEAPDLRALAKKDPKALLARYLDGVI